MKAIKRPCKGKTPEGADCRAAAVPGSDFCFFHDPDQADKRREAQAFGGSQNRMKTLDADAPEVKVEDCGDVVALISDTINQVRKGQLDPRAALADLRQFSHCVPRGVDRYALGIHDSAEWSLHQPIREDAQRQFLDMLRILGFPRLVRVGQDVIKEKVYYCHFNSLYSVSVETVYDISDRGHIAVSVETVFPV